MIVSAISATSPEGIVLAAPLITFGLVAAWLDLKFRRIPNWLCGLLAFIGFAVAVWVGGPQALVLHGLHFAAALLVGMVLFGLGVFGGGDAKFYAAVAAWFPITAWAMLAIHVSVSGLALLLVWFSFRRLTGQKIRPKNPTIYDSLPYGIAIASGAIAIMVR